MVVSLEIGRRHLRFENWPDSEPVRSYSLGLDVVAEPGERFPPEAGA